MRPTAFISVKNTCSILVVTRKADFTADSSHAYKSSWLLETEENYYKTERKKATTNSKFLVDNLCYGLQSMSTV